MGVMDKLAAKKQILESSNRLINYMSSVDNNLKELGSAFNDNMKLIAKEIEKINKKLDQIENGIVNNTKD